MTFNTEWTLVCDGEEKGCEGSLDPYLSKEETILAALNAGWHLGTKKHYCPVCRQVQRRGRRAGQTSTTREKISSSGAEVNGGPRGTEKISRGKNVSPKKKISTPASAPASAASGRGMKIREKISRNQGREEFGKNF